MLEPEDLALWQDLAAGRRAVERALEQRLQEDAGVSAVEFEVLTCLGRADGHRLRAGGLAEQLGWEKSRISHQLGRMDARGLVTRAGCPTDGRGTWVALSERGADALAAGSCGYVEVLQHVLVDGLDPAEKRALRSAARRFATVDGERGRVDRSDRTGPLQAMAPQ